MWNVILNFRNGETQPWSFPNKEAAQYFLNTVVFKNEDCINCNVYKDIETVNNVKVESTLQETLDSIKWKLDLVEKITSKS